MENIEIIEFDAFNPDDYNNYQSPLRKEQNMKLLKFILILLIFITIAAILRSIVQSRND